MTWRLAAASVTGSSHLDRDLPCQDAHAYRLLPGGTLVLAVADGAGSAARAEDGARLAARTAVERLAELCEALADTEDNAVGVTDTVVDAVADSNEAEAWSARVAAVFRDAREALEELAIEEFVSLRDFACTLTCAVLAPDRLVVGQVGDGVAVARAADGTLFAASQPQKGEYANEARFLTMPDALEHVDTRVFEQPIDALAVTSDGLLRLALQLPDHRPHDPFFTPLFAFVAQAADPEAAGSALAAFLASPRICARTDDDKTLVIAVRAGVGELGGAAESAQVPERAEIAEAAGMAEATVAESEDIVESAEVAESSVLAESAAASTEPA